MTLTTSGYTVTGNQPLSHARILYAPIVGTVTADGTDGALAANDYTFQRWAYTAGSAEWVLTAGAAVGIDTVIIGAHTLSGTTVTIQTSPDLVSAFTTRAVVTPSDNSTIACMFNNSGSPFVPFPDGETLALEDDASLLLEDGDTILVEGIDEATQRVKIVVQSPTGGTVGIIRAGVALQMQRPLFGGIEPIGLSRIVETRHAMSETGQWLGRTIQRQARRTSMPWLYLTAAWYRSEFEPFALTLPQSPFGFIQNPEKMPESVAWAWCDETPAPSNMGVKDLMSVSLNITGFLE